MIILEIAKAIALALAVFQTVGPAANRFISAINREITDDEKEAALFDQDEAVGRLRACLGMDSAPIAPAEPTPAVFDGPNPAPDEGGGAA